MPRKSDVPTKAISITVPHVYMPVDLFSPDWGSMVDTKRYEAKEEDGRARTKYMVHADLADFLIGRDQAIEVPAAVPEQP